MESVVVWWIIRFAELLALLYFLLLITYTIR